LVKWHVIEVACEKYIYKKSQVYEKRDLCKTSSIRLRTLEET